MLGENAAEGNKVGLVTFSGNVTQASGLVKKDEKQQLLDAIKRMQANGGTNIQAGLRKAAGMLTDSSREQFIIGLYKLQKQLLFRDP